MHSQLLSSHYFQTMLTCCTPNDLHYHRLACRKQLPPPLRHHAVRASETIAFSLHVLAPIHVKAKDVRMRHSGLEVLISESYRMFSHYNDLFHCKRSRKNVMPHDVTPINLATAATSKIQQNKTCHQC